MSRRVLQLASALSTLVLGTAAAACDGNTATTRDQWCDFSIDSDYTTEVPDTGVTREYWFDLQDIEISPDGGVTRSAMAVNGSIPGPTVYADWGDEVTIHVTNSLTTSMNGSSIHWHGIPQNFTNGNDGVVSITQCPTQPGDTTTYTWKATRYGSSWYHSHFGLQAWQGIYGGMVINGPATANYDIDLGMMSLSDWSNQTVDELYPSAEINGPPTLTTGLINGTNVYNGGGYRWNTTVEAGTSYRLRLVNVAVDSHFKFSIDNHELTVIAMDFVPITPYTAESISIGMGQRYDVIFTANQDTVADNFWLRAIPASSCSENDNTNDIRGIISYTGDMTEEPTTSAYNVTSSCADEDLANLVPYLSLSPGDFDTDTNVDVNLFTNLTTGIGKWTLNSTSMWVDWEDPTVNQVSNGITTFEEQDAVISLPDANVWFYLVIINDLTFWHPIHLHGHDFSILAQVEGATYDPETVVLNTSNPPRRDTAMLPSSGYLVIGFETDNPGAWLMHCHIGWHTSEGFGLQFIERYDEIAAIVDADAISSTCAAWSSFLGDEGIVQEDSGF